MKRKLYRQHLRTALVYFIIAALLGVLLRSFPLLPFTFNYRYMVHAHSHIALLGWVYVGLTTLLHFCFVEKKGSSKRYTYIFWATQASLIGMLLTFPFQGYGLHSIIFSTLFLIVSYVYVYHFRKYTDPAYTNSKSLICARYGLTYMVISSVGPWALGAIMSTLGGQSIWYRLAVYFYLHFQYNGWMILALIALYLFILERNGFLVPKKHFNRFMRAMNLGILLSFLLSTLWSEPPLLLYILAGIGAILQLYAFFTLWSVTKHAFSKLSLSNFQKHLFKVIVLLVCIKISLQALTTLPYFAKMASIHLNLTIGYLHLTFLGVISLALFFYMDYFRWFQIPKTTYLWYLTGFLLTEILIFHKGFAAWFNLQELPGYTILLTLGSLPILLSLLFILRGNRHSPP